MPPGLLPREDPGPKRLRASGRTIRFPKEQDWPKFLMQLGQLDLTVGGDNAAQGAYAATVQGLTSDPALYGKPTIVRTTRRAEGSAVENIAVDAVIDHVRSDRVKDSASARLRGVKLPSFEIPGLPFRVDPGTGAANLDFSMRNDQLRGRWANQLESGRLGARQHGEALNDLEGLVWRVVSGLKNLAVVAELSGRVRAPKLSVSSNLDQAIAERLQAVIGEEVAKAEKMVRAKVDSLVADKVEPVKRQIAECPRAGRAATGGRAEAARPGRGAAPGGAQAADRRAGAGD